MKTIQNATPSEYDEIQAFLEEAYNHPRHFFPLHYPCYWRRENMDYQRTYLIREGARLGSLVRVFPLDLILGNVRVTVGGIGGVATSPRCTGKGYMSQLLRHAIAEMKAEGLPLSFLWGDRHRYLRWGYERGGTLARLTITRRSLDKTGIRPATVTQYLGQPDLLANIKRSYEGNAYRRVRAEEDFGLLYQGPSLLVFCAGRDSQFGYLGLFRNSGGCSVAELGGDPHTILGIARSLMDRLGVPSFGLIFPGWDSVPPVVRQAACNWRTECASQIKVLDLEKTIRAFASQNQGQRPPPLGRLRKLPEPQQVEALFGTRSDGPFNLFVWPLDNV